MEPSSSTSTMLRRKSTEIARRVFPIITWMPALTKRYIIDDLRGGFVVGVMAVPMALSWATLAGISLSCGLQAALVGLVSYAIFGRSPVIAVVPVAELTALLISIPNVDVDDREHIFQSLGVQVGLLSVLLSFMDGGKVIDIVFAKAVGDAYTCAAALLATCTQIKVMLNVEAPSKTLLQEVLVTTIKAAVEQLTPTSLLCAALFLLYTSYLIFIKKMSLPSWIPHPLIVIVFSTLLTWGFRLDEKLGLQIVEDIPSTFSWPHFPPWVDVMAFGPYTLALTMVSYVQIYVVAKRASSSSSTPSASSPSTSSSSTAMMEIDPNVELLASGATNFLSCILGGMPVSNSFSCSSVLMEQRVHSPLTSMMAGGMVFTTIVFLTRLGVFYYLPKQTLGAIIVASVMRLMDFHSPIALWRYSKKDAVVWIITFALTIFGGITVGVLGGVMLSLVLVVLRIARPRAVTVGLNANTSRFGDLRKDPELLVYPRVLVWRFDAPLYFINTRYFQERLIEAIRDEVRPIDAIIISCAKIVDIDAAALSVLPEMLHAIAISGGDDDDDDEHHDFHCRPRLVFLTELHGRLEQVIRFTRVLPIYVAEEHEAMSVAEMRASNKFPVVVDALEVAIGFAQRCLREDGRGGCGVDVDASPYPSVSFWADFAMEAARLAEQSSTPAATSALALMQENDEDEEGQTLALDYPTLDAIGELPRSPHHDDHRRPVLQQQLEKLRRRHRLVKEDRELIGVLGIVRHTEVTPKQKKKLLFTEPTLLAVAFAHYDEDQLTSRSTIAMSTEDEDAMADAVEEMLRRGGQMALEDDWRRVWSILRSRPDGLKTQIKPLTVSRQTSSTRGTRRQVITSALLVVKWGGVLTHSGITQARELGEKLFARFVAAGDLAMERWPTFTQRPTVVASDDPRVVHTALAVMNALTQQPHTTLGEEEMELNDCLMKVLSPAAKLLLREEYRYFEAIMHVDRPSAVYRYLHIPGYRRLVSLPTTSSPGGIPRASSLHESPKKAILPPGDSKASHGTKKDEEADEEEERLRTPMEVLYELEGHLHTVVNALLPHNILQLPLSNHETLNELRQRYESLQHNFLGAKRTTTTTTSTAPTMDSPLVVNQTQASYTNSRGHTGRRKGSRAASWYGGREEAKDEGVEEEEEEDEEDVHGEKRYRTQLPTFAPINLGVQTYDVSDISKLRDYGLYDLTYNLPLLQAVFNAAPLPELWELIYALQRIAVITECAAHVGENVMIGLNRSKRFLVGALVSGALLERLCVDVKELAALDVHRGVESLLTRAQRLYVQDHAGVEDEMQNCFSTFNHWRQKFMPSASAHPPPPPATPTAAELRRYPFIGIQSPTPQRSHADITSSILSYTRFYFSSHLHVEGILQCLSESCTLRGGCASTEEELEISSQRYMRHLIWKVIRRRNPSIPNAELHDAMRRLPLLFVGSVNYEQQQEHLREELTALYHSLYHVSVEIYLSVGDASAASALNQSSAVKMQEEMELQDAPPAADVQIASSHQPQSAGGAGSGWEGLGISSADVTLAEELMSPHISCDPPLSQSGLLRPLSPTELNGSILAVVAPPTPPRSEMLQWSMQPTTPQQQLNSSTWKLAEEMAVELRRHLNHVTPMRRVHDGLRVDQLEALVREVKAAVRSQSRDES